MRGALFAAFLSLLSLPAAAQNYIEASRPSTDISGTVTTGGTYQQIAPSNLNRQDCFVQNPTTATEILSLKLITAAGAMSQAITLAAGSSWDSSGASDAIEVTGATTGHAFAGYCN